jgi:nitroreductase
MTDRRDFLIQSVAAATALPLAACGESNMEDYDGAAARIRAPVPVNADFANLVRFATLAPNGHNTQPWRFAERPSGARILPDLTRRTPVVDPDDHHLFVSLGSAAENFIIASSAQGRLGAMTFVGEGEGRIDIDLVSGAPQASPLFQAIPARQSTRSIYDGRAVSAQHLTLLAEAARIEGVTLMVITDPSKREAVLDFLVRGNNAQMDDPHFVDELRDWIRFNPEQALASGDGLFSKCTGNPAIPTWIGKRFFGMVFKKDAENKKYVAQMRSSAGVAVFIGDKADKDHWVRVGRSFQRFALQATALGIRHAMVNQPVEVPAIRAEFARWLGIGEMRPDLVVRFGHAPPMPMSMRRPARAAIVGA